MRRIAALMAMVLLTGTAGCSGTTKNGSTSSAVPNDDRQITVLRAEPFGDQALGVVNDVLARSGVGVNDNGGEVTTHTTMRLTRWQVRNLAIEAANGGGVPAEELSAAVPVPADAPPLPYLIAAWIKTYDSPGARFSRALMGDQDWTHADRAVFPGLVLTLFTADAVAGAGHPTASSGTQSTAPAAMTLPGGPCTFAATFIQTAIADVAAALKTDTSGGGFGGFLGKIWNVAVDLAATAVKGLISAVTKPVVDAMADAFGVVATIVQVTSFLTEWRAELKPDPTHTRFGVDSEQVDGRFQLAVTQDQTAWPDVVLDCARAVNVDLLAIGSAAGSPVSWTAQNTGRADLSARISADDKLAQDKTASYRYQTGQESSQTATSPDTESFALVVTASVQRQDVRKTRELFTKLLLENIPDPIRGIVTRLAQPLLDQADTRLAALTAVTASARTFITFHTPTKATPTAPPTAGGSTPSIGRRATMPTNCPGPDLITRASPRPSTGESGPWGFDGDILPSKALGGAKTCGYSASLGPKDPATGFQTAEQIGIFLDADPDPMAFPRTDPVTIPGADQAWWNDGALYVVIGGRGLVITVQIRVTEDQKATAIRVANAMLSG